MKHINQNLILTAVIIIISAFALWPFFKKGFFESHDGEWMVIRFTAFHQTLSSGQFPVRFVERLNNNYGYPVLNFLYPAPFYFSEIFKIFKINFVNSIKLTFVLTTLASSALMFWALSKKFNQFPSLAGAILYIYSPYRFVDLYVRGSIGENMAFAALPLILGSIFQIEKGKKIYLPILSISVALLIMSHNVIAAIYLPIIILFSVLLLKKQILKTLLSIVLGILIAAFFWIPALYDLQFVRLSQVSVADPISHLVNLGSLLIPKWGYDPNPNQPDGFSTQIGIITFLILITSSILLFKKKISNKLATSSLLVSFFAIFLMTKASAFFWETIPYVNIIQFPWRLLSIIVFTNVLLLAILLNNLKNKTIISITIIILAITTTFSYTKPKNFVNRQDSFYSTNEDTTTVVDEYLPLWVKQKPDERANEKFVLEDVTAQNIKIRPTYYEANLISDEPKNITINTIYFPGFKTTINGKNTAINYNNKFGLINFELPKGVSKVIIKYGETPVHLFSEILSLLSLFITGIIFYQLWQKQKF